MHKLPSGMLYRVINEGKKKGKNSSPNIGDSCLVLFSNETQLMMVRRLRPETLLALTCVWVLSVCLRVDARALFHRSHTAASSRMVRDTLSRDEYSLKGTPVMYIRTCHINTNTGTPFDSGTTSFAPNQVIAGWTEALQAIPLLSLPET